MGSRDPLTPEGVEIYKSMADRAGMIAFNNDDVLRLVSTVEERNAKAKSVEARLVKALRALEILYAQSKTLLSAIRKERGIVEPGPQAVFKEHEAAYKKDPVVFAATEAFYEALKVIEEEKAPK